MQEEQDTCRICSAPAEPDQPLFYPCKCSGTIRYIHQDCLTTWLAHSKKKTCDVCKYPYSFTKVYASDMPARLPITLVIRRLIQQAALAVLFAFRGILVGTVWLAFLPWATVWTWRMYFAMGDATAWWISTRPKPEPSLPNGTFNASSSSAQETDVPPVSSNATLLTTFLLHPTVRSVSADIVTGQIIASVIVLGFVAVFLLREWISQNARPGVFDDAELPPEGEVPQAEPAEEIPQIMEAQPEQVHDRDQEGVENVPVPVLQPPVIPPPLASGEDTSSSSDSNSPSPVEDDNGRSGGRKVRRRIESPERIDRPRAKSVPHRLPSSANDLGFSESRPLDLKPEQQEFTFSFRVSPRNTQDQEHDEEQMQKADRAHVGSSLDGYLSGPVFRTEFSAAGVPYAPMPGDSNNHARYLPKPSQSSEHSEPAESSQKPQAPQLPHPFQASQTLRRPPMPSISLPPSALNSPSIAPKSRGPTPISSPSLATYSAPEEFEAGPSTLSEYFKKEDYVIPEDSEETKREHDRYFREPEAGEEVHSAVPEGKEDETTEVDSRDSSHDTIVAPQWSDDEYEEEEEEDNEDHEDALVPFGEPLPDENEELWRAAGLVVGDRNADRDAEGDGERDANGELRADGEPLDAEEMDANIEDDMDGALEAIGLRGPIYGVLQNAAFMTFVLDATIGILVWLPFTIGKTLALLSLDPARLLEVIHSPIRAIRFITDPVVDLVSYVLTQVVLLPLALSLQQGLLLVVSGLGRLVGSDQASKGVEVTSAWYNRTLEAVNVALDQTRFLLLSPEANATTTATPSLLERLAENDSPLMRLLEPYFAPIGSVVRTQFQAFKETWIHLATSDSTSSKIFAIALGYALDVLIMAIYLNVLTFGSVKSAGKAVRSAMRQQLLVLKVAVFIIIELVVFPLGCGIMLDACSVWLLPQSSLRSRMAFLTFAPLTAAFYHWVIGTMFMYQFAVLLAGCRSIMRPGSMWFVKDPQDQNFHPIRDILERPTLVQIKKLLLSAVMYGIVVGFSIATFSGILRFFSRTIMPLRWKVLEPLSEVPIDLLFFHLVLPYTLHYFRPRRGLYKASVKIWKFLAHQLRLSSYMFGDRYPMEEFTPKHWSWKRLILRPGIELLDDEAIHDGTFWRVPNHDNIAQVRNERAIVEVDENGLPRDAEGHRLMALLDVEASRAKRDVKTDYTIVYVPPDFRRRVMTFIVCLWLIGAVILAGSLALPILIGRSFFELFTSRPIHDGYSFIAGFYLLWACWLVVMAAERMDRRRQRRGGDEPRARLPLYLAKRGLLWLAKVLYLGFFLGVVIPTLVALVVELYIVLPVRHAYNPDMELRIRIVDMWALGLLYSKIALRAHRVQADGLLAHGIEQIKRNGWSHPDPLRATKEVIVPITFGLLSMILVPPLIIWFIHRAFSLELEQSVLCNYTFRFITILSLTIILTSFARISRYLCHRRMHSWIGCFIKFNGNMVSSCTRQGVPRGDAAAKSRA
ncbi:unnamed protein product [Somion occarium]|uniref:RING-type E3 ubiquitin transferase n=1 Tax=Somion occarium TaxID=3059160 RepID=A0ABP1E511_9APHY